MASHIERRKFLATLGGAAAWPLAARAQQAGKIHKVGYLSPSLPSVYSPLLFDDLRELGWFEGKNVTFEYRFAENRLERLPELAAELVRLNVDVIVAVGTLGPLAAKRATTTIPIVMLSAGDPLGTGLVDSLARPGGNVTGMSLMVPDLGGKRLELLKELLPRLSRVAMLWNAANPYPAIVFKETQAAGRKLGIEVHSLEVRGPDDLDGAFAAARLQHPDALISVEDPLTFTYRKRIADFAVAEQLPSLHGFSEEVKAGALISYQRLSNGLAAFANWCAGQGVSPGEVDDPVVQRFLTWLETRTLQPRPRDLVRRVPNIWNEASAKFSSWPATKLTGLSFKAPPTHLKWSELSQTFQQEAEAYFKLRANPDLFDERPEAPKRPLAASTLRQQREHLRLAASILVQNGEVIASLADLVVRERFKRILRHYHKQANGEANAFVIGLAKTLIQVAQYHTGATTKEISELKRLAANLPPVPFDLTAKNKTLLRQLESERLRAKLYFSPSS